MKNTFAVELVVKLSKQGQMNYVGIKHVGFLMI